MRRLPAILLLALFATPALAAGGSPGFRAGDVALLGIFGLLAMGSGFFLGGLLKLPMTVLVYLFIALIVPICFCLMMDFDRAGVAAALEGMMLLVFSPAIALGWWLGRKDEMRRINRRNLLSGSNHG
jgi:hypothetical protein